MTSRASKIGRTLAAALLSSCALSSQDLSTKLDAALDELAKADSHFGYAVATAGPEGPIDVRVAGSLDGETAFEKWQLVPLGTHTTLLLEKAMRDAIAAGKLDWQRKVLGSGDDAIDLESAWLDDHLPIPGYLRYVESSRAARPLAEVVRSHAYRLVKGEYPLCSQSMLRHALAQTAIESATGRAWHESLREVGHALGMASLVDLSHAWPARGVAIGHRADGRPWPVRLAEVPAYGNAACSMEDVVQLARACLRDERKGHAAEDPHDLRPARRLQDEYFDEFTASIRGRSSTEFGCTLAIHMLPESGRLVVLFGTRPSGEWLAKLTTRSFALALGVDEQTQQIDEFAVSESVDAIENIEQRITGTYRGIFTFGDTSLQLELVANDSGSKAKLSPTGEGQATLVENDFTRNADSALGGLVLPADRADASHLEYRFIVAVDDKDSDRLVGSIYRVMETADGLEIECLPSRIRLRRVP